MIMVVLILSVIQTSKGTCVPPDCNDNDPCTQDTCVSGTCSHIGNCTITSTITISPSKTPSTSRLFPTITVTPLISLTVSGSPSPQLAISTVTRSPVAIVPSSASPLIPPTASQSAGIPPSGFPVQSETSTFTVSASPPVSPVITNPATSIPTFIEPPPPPPPSITSSQSPSAAISPPPSASPSGIAASPLPERVGAPTTVLVQLDCGSSDCCSNFTGSWSSLVAINSPYLLDLLTCDTINTNLISVTYNQFGSDFYDAHQIIDSYWVQGNCANLDPFTDGPCFPSNGFLSSPDWQTVVEISVLNRDYTYSFTTNYSTDNLTYYSLQILNSTSDALFLLPSLILLLCFFLY